MSFYRSCLKVIATVATTASLAQADNIELGQPAYGGTGCPAGTASASVSPTGDALSILFDRFVVEAGGITGVREARKSCSLSIPVRIPQGYSVAVIRTDFRIYNLIPSGGARNRLETEYFWAGVQGPRFSATYVGPLDKNEVVPMGIIAESLVWTPCGASVNMRVKTDIRTRTNSWMDESTMTVDSADFTGSIVYHLQWRRCQ